MRKRLRRISHKFEATKYLVKMIRRISLLLVWLFILFAIIMGIIWAVPMVWRLAFG